MFLDPWNFHFEHYSRFTRTESLDLNPKSNLGTNRQDGAAHIKSNLDNMSVPYIPRESHMLIVEPGSYRIKAGMAEPNGTVFAIPTLIGSRSGTTEPRISSASKGGLLGSSSTLTTSSESVNVPRTGIATTTVAENSHNDVDGTVSVGNTSPTMTPSSLKKVVHVERFCGDLLDEELKHVAQDPFKHPSLRISSPIQGGLVSDWDDLEAVLANMLARHFLIKRRANTYPIMFVVPARWNRLEWERLCQLAFERLNVPALYITEQALMATHGCNAATSVVINIGHAVTEVTPVVDNLVLRHASRTIAVGSHDIDVYTARLLQADPRVASHVMAQLGPQPNWIELARAVKESAIAEVRSMPPAYGRMDMSVPPAEFEYMAVKLNVGYARTHGADVLFDPSLVGKFDMSIQEAVVAAVSMGAEMEKGKRMALYEGLILTGAGCLLKGLQKRLEEEMAPFLAAADTSNELQANEVRFLKCPDFFVAYKDRPMDWSFLGTSIVAKHVFLDIKAYMNKMEYNEYGPSFITSTNARSG
ncbi:hypothetical protein SeMB42_g05687 [Synchytrium endobioticum]|uniref:Actin-related protein 8 n=1 Tax=Synchytrium endobioticum TaxID=286115 RepID=A0A507CXM0_9FUNG|nr:hypothetical protein SeMB42_g05687 [Synchytrium endobioticum]TPX43967.1 hypothetical protein SeLEV6574_g04782 [Synchytrium endobioticum]